jgi:predicted nucleic acid-binding protein
VFLIDTNAISELRKRTNADQGAVEFLKRSQQDIFLPVQVIGELRAGIEGLHQRGDLPQAQRLESWFQYVLETFDDRILTFDAVCAETWGALMGSSNQNKVDKQIAAIALVYDLTVVTRNVDHFAGTGARLLNPFLAA